MTQLRKQKDAISNYFDSILAGIGHRGSSFTDIDGATHDGATKRWLFQEFKQDGEKLDKAQRWMLRDISTLPAHFTVWVVVKRDDGRIGWASFPDITGTYRIITVEEYQARFAAWWANKRFVDAPEIVKPCNADRWCGACGCSLQDGVEEWFSSGPEIHCSDCHYSAQDAALYEAGVSTRGTT